MNAKVNIVASLIIGVTTGALAQWVGTPAALAFLGFQVAAGTFSSAKDHMVLADMLTFIHGSVVNVVNNKK